MFEPLFPITLLLLPTPPLAPLKAFELSRSYIACLPKDQDQRPGTDGCTHTGIMKSILELIAYIRLAVSKGLVDEIGHFIK